MSDRQVHARLASGSEVVRYNRAGKWYLEHLDGSRCRLTLAEAVGYALRPDSARYWNRPGGQSFDARLRLRLRDGF